MAFTLRIENSHIDYLVNDIPYDTRLFYYGVSWHESLNQLLKISAHTGMLEVSQSSNPLEAAHLRNGQYMAVALHLLPVRTDFMDVTLSYEYAYHDVTGRTFDQSSNLNWTGQRSEIELLLRPVRTLYIKAAAELSRSVGKQRDSGTLVQEFNMSEAEQFGQRLSLELQLDASGAVGLDYMTGGREGSRLYFLRRFY